MPNYNFVTETFDCSKGDLPHVFETYKCNIELKNDGKAPLGTLAATTGLTINGTTSFTMQSVAEAAIIGKVKPGGEAHAVLLAQPDPETGSPINHGDHKASRRGERRMVWLVGAKCLTGPPAPRRSSFRSP